DAVDLDHPLLEVEALRADRFDFARQDHGRFTVATSEGQPALSSALGERAHAAVVAVAAAIEDTAGDSRLLRPCGEELAHALGGLQRGELADLRLGPRDRGDRSAARVIDELGGDAAVGPKDRKPGPLGGAADLGAHATAAPQPCLRLRLDGQAMPSSIAV